MIKMYWGGECGFFAEEISKSCMLLLKKSTIGSVHSVFENVLNINIENNIISLSKNQLYRTPGSIRLGAFKNNFREFNIRAMDRVEFEKNSIMIGHYEFMLDKARIFNSHLDKNIKIIRFNICEIILRVLKIYGADKGFSRLIKYMDVEVNKDGNKNDYVKSAAIILNASKKLIKEGRALEAAKKLSLLIGVGEGLTPSGDDFLIGLMSVLSQFDYLDGKKLLSPLKNEILGGINGTTDISREYLRYACCENYSELFHNFYTSIEKGIEKDVYFDAIRFTGVGASSGCDTLAGIYFGFSLFT